MNNSVLTPFVRMAWAPGIVLIIHVVATLAGWYEDLWWFDILMHFIGGIAITLAAYHMLEFFSNNNQFDSESKPLKILILIAFAGLAAVCWELMEHSFDMLANTQMQGGMSDTIKDMCLGLLGGGIVAICTTLFKTKKDS